MYKSPSPLIKGVILDRYKRFLAKVIIPSEDKLPMEIYVPNTGPMKTCWEPQWPVLLSKSDNPKRRLAFTLEATHNGICWIGVNTQRANKIVHHSLLSNHFNKSYIIKDETQIIPEWALKGSDSRFDFLLQNKNLLPRVIEVKNTTWMIDPNSGTVSFPDTKSQRGAKHLKELISLQLSKNYNCTMIYVVPRMDARVFSVEQSADLEYCQLLKQAIGVGIEIIVAKYEVSEMGIVFNSLLSLLCI